MTQPSEECSAARVVSEMVAMLTLQITALRGSLKLSSTDLTARMDEMDKTLADVLNGVKGPAALCWDGIPQELYEKQQAEVKAWVADVLEPGNPMLRLPSCWPDHRDVLAELGNAMGEWQHIYLPARPPLKLALDYYDRYLPGILRRAGTALDRCRTSPQCILLPPKGTTR